MRHVVRLVAGALAVGLAASGAQAQVAPSQVNPGMQVYDAQRGLVGAVSKVQGGYVYVHTDKHDVPVNPGSFTLDGGKLYLGMTRAQLNSGFETEVAAAAAALQPGKPVKGSDQVVIGTIETIDSNTVVVALTSGQKIQLGRASVVGSSNGAMIGVTSAELARQLAAPAPPAAPGAAN